MYDIMSIRAREFLDEAMIVRKVLQGKRLEANTNLVLECAELVQCTAKRGASWAARKHKRE